MADSREFPGIPEREFPAALIQSACERYLAAKSLDYNAKEVTLWLVSRHVDIILFKQKNILTERHSFTVSGACPTADSVRGSGRKRYMS